MCDETKGLLHRSEANQKVCKSSMHLCLTPQACTHNQMPRSLQVITIRICTVVVIHCRLIRLYPWPNCPFRMMLCFIHDHIIHINRWIHCSSRFSRWYGVMVLRTPPPLCGVYWSWVPLGQKARLYQWTLSITGHWLPLTPLLSEEFNLHVYWHLHYGIDVFSLF